jgi:hypothetical protein
MRLFNLINNLPKKHLLLLSVLSAVFYNSWILGYIFNKSQVNNAYYSVLESPGKPHFLLYVTLDVLCGFIIMIIGFYLYKLIKKDLKIIIYYLAFGFFIILDALNPISDKCSSTISACGYSLAQIFSYHDVLGIIEFTIIFILLKNISKIAENHNNLRYRKIIRYNFVGYIYSLVLLVLSIPIDMYTGLTQGLVIILSSLTITMTPLVIILDKNRNIN